MSISLLPTELLVKIFNYLCIETQIRVEATCFRWRNIIIQNFFLPFLLRQPYSIRYICGSVTENDYAVLGPEL